VAAPDPFRPTRITLDLESNSQEAGFRPLADLASDFYGCDPRRVGRPYRYGYMGARDPSRPPAPGYDTIVRLDHETGQWAGWWAGEACAAQEPLFVPKAEDAPEGDGWLMVVVNDHARRRAELRILDAARPGSEPVGAARLPFNIPTALHGTFAPAGA
jgi:carotenoid cleavage dioxygenase